MEDSGTGSTRDGSGPGRIERWVAQVASTRSHELGEGPVWDAERGRLLWVDIAAGAVHEGRLAGDTVNRSRSWAVDRTVGAVVPTADGGLLVAGEHRLWTIDGPDAGRPIHRGGTNGSHGDDGTDEEAPASRRSGPRLLPHGSTRRLNDGGCDPAGRFLVGSLSRDGARGGDALRRLELDGRLTELDSDLTLSNGLDWSPDGRRLYSVDSVPGVVWVRRYDVATGEVGPREALLRVRDGTPDGLCVDAAGDLWVAIWGAGEVRRYSPDGVLTGVVEVPAPHTTSVTFAGERLDRLVITTATAELSAAELETFPLSGRLFTVRVGAVGRPGTAWAGSFGRAG